MPYSLFILLTIASIIVPSIWGQIITYTPSKGCGVSYSINVPESTDSYLNGTIYLQLSAPPHTKWMALSQGRQMTGGNLIVIYSSPGGNVTLSPRKALGHSGVFHDPNSRTSLLEGSGIHDGVMTANIRCESCMQLNRGDSIMGSSSPWGWAMSSGTPLASGNVSATIQMHDYHGIFTVDLTKAIGGNSSNPFLDTTYSRLNVTPSKQLQVDEAFLIRKRIAHGGMTPIAFLLLFPNFAILIHIFPSRYVAWIHALLQMFTTCLALAGLGVGVFVAKDLQVVGGYHQTIGYVVIGGIVLFQPFLGFMQHRHFRKTGETSLYGLSHRWFGRLFMVIGIVNGGLGFHYAYQNTPDIPPAAPIIYGVVCGVVGLIYLFVIMRSRRKARSKTANTVSRTLSGLSNSIEMSGISREKSRLP